jgi:hypothetical protein
MASAAPAQPMDVRRFLAVETFVNAVVSGVLSAGFVVLVFGGRDIIPLWGMDGLAFDLIPTVFMITLMMTIGLTLFTRSRCRRGRAPLSRRASRLPGNVLLRALLLAISATVLLVPASVGLLHLLGLQGWSYSAVMLFKIIYGVVLAAAITPVIVIGAMRDVGGAR